ncbi:hypothetical protein JW921_04215 [Candidatus Fermentibacterales bacterium]|nr:hypothetical protein [Candidatus Fermentibacterales bacterium]
MSRALAFASIIPVVLLTLAGCGGEGRPAAEPSGDAPGAAPPDTVAEAPVILPPDTIPAEVMYAISENGLGLCFVDGDLPCADPARSFVYPDSVLLHSSLWSTGSAHYCLFSRREPDPEIVYDTFALRDLLEGKSGTGSNCRFEYGTMSNCTIGEDCSCNESPVTGRRFDYTIYRNDSPYLEGTAYAFWHDGFVTIVFGQAGTTSREYVAMARDKLDMIVNGIYFGGVGQPAVDVLGVGPPY